MSSKWLDMAFRRQKQEAPNGTTNGQPVPANRAPGEAAAADKTQAHAGGKDLAKPQGDLQAMADIYRAAGILNPRMGYSISKVIEMLNSEHLRALPNDTKRAAVLMALDAAGISIEEVLRDATRRQAALDAYEADQRKQFEDYWGRKAGANAQIQAEMERVTAQYLDRINRNLNEVALEKAALAKWQTMKQQEAERISEAAGLCSKPCPSEPPSGSLLALREISPIVNPS
jgi:hypothetical protein